MTENEEKQETKASEPPAGIEVIEIAAGDSPSENTLVVEHLQNLPPLISRGLVYLILGLVIFGLTYSLIAEIDVVAECRAVARPLSHKLRVIADRTGYIERVFVTSGQEVERTLHEQGFEPLEIPFENKEPKKIIVELETKNKKIAKEKRALEDKLRAAWKGLHARLDVLDDEVSVVRERNHALELMRAGMGFAILEAWVPGTDFEKFRALVERIAKDYYLESAERGDAPTIYDNPRIIKPFEMLTSLYDVPKYKTIDPTPVLAVSFTLFFGFMLTDFFYGILLVLFGYLIFRGIGKYNAGMRQFTAVLIMAGISTAVLGAVFGSYMGDIFTKFGIHLPMVIDPMKQVVIVIAASLIIGAAHLGTALVMGYYENVKKGRIKDAFAKQGVWLAFLIGIVFAIIDGGLFQLIGFSLIGIAVLMNLYFSFRESGPIVSALSVFNFSGFVGDVFSYARLTALAVGTAGIALAVNFMALMVAGMIPIIGIPLAIVVFIVGHLFNMVMNGLGAFVHSLRLHFLEFFSKFYDGGGRLYKPFYAMRTKNYTEVDEWQ